MSGAAAGAAGDVTVRVLESTQAVAAAAAELLADRAAAGGHVALSGGSTPEEAYRMAASRQPDWRGAVLWFGDERCVAPDDPRSNFGMVERALLSRLSGDKLPEVVRVPGERGADAAARDYEDRLRERLGEAPVLDLALMGLGPDAHTASLFPGKPALREASRLAVAVPEPGLEPAVARVTLTFKVFNAARDVVFLVAGEGKAEAMRRAFGREPDPDAPAARVRPASGRLLVLCDEGAASLL